MAVANRDTRRADRVRAAICVSLANTGGRSMTISELVAAVTSCGIPLGVRPNKTIADAIRWELRRGHVRKVGHGRYRVGDLPRCTLHYMRVRVEAYATDPGEPYARPSNLPDARTAPPECGDHVEPPIQVASLSKRLEEWDAKRPRVL